MVSVPEVSTHTQGGHTALLIAANNGHLGCVAALIAAGADLEAKNKVRANSPAASLAATLCAPTPPPHAEASPSLQALEMTALHLAAAKAHVHVAETLLDNGAEIDSRNRVCTWRGTLAVSRIAAALRLNV